MLGLLAQIEIFFLTLLLGIIAGIIFHYYQLTLSALRARRYSLYLLDLFFWLFMILLISCGMLLINQGVLRIYIFLVLFAGSLIYFKHMAGFMKRPLGSLAKGSVRILRMIGKSFIGSFEWLKKGVQSYWRRLHVSPPPEDN